MLRSGPALRSTRGPAKAALRREILTNLSAEVQSPPDLSAVISLTFSITKVPSSISSGARTDAGRQVFTYGYRVAEELSYYKVRTSKGWVITAFDGTFDIGTAALELLGITVGTPALPSPYEWRQHG